jgi:membrane protease YdiL (CAAX protease family)
VSRVRLFFWVVLVGGIGAVNYAAYGKTSGHSDDIYKWSTFAAEVVFYGIVFGITMLIALDRWDLFALRLPNGFRRVAGLAFGVIASIIALEYLVVLLPIEDPGKEQGLAPTHWEQSHAGAFAANVAVFCLLAPFVEELLFRGVGYSLLRPLGAAPAVLLIGVAFGVWHGLLIALLILVPFGSLLAYLRERTDSVVPGMVVHGLFNAAAISVSVLKL